ncbi:sensor histidine kinase [Bacillus sp. JJ722]|uniref:sensor histidine kinase n=1 Tax=Bacillus sp. JJ722 TaxID=3122973 RepID=UPI002FFF657F
MKIEMIYWGFIAILSTIYLDDLLGLSPQNLSLYLLCLLIFIISYYLYKKTNLHLSTLGKKINGILILIQLLLIFMNLFNDSFLVAIISFIIFIGIEIIRVISADRIVILSQAIQQLENQCFQLNETFRVVRSERHDFLKHVSAIHFMLDKGEHYEAKAYLDTLVDGYKETNLSIKGERGTIAGVLHQMYKRAQHAGISAIYDLDLPLSTLPLSDQEIVKLIGNLLSNCIDACEEWQQNYNQQANLSIQFFKRSGIYILICKNNSMPIPAPVVDQLYETYGHTTKTGNHEGLGTKIIHDIVVAHKGFLDFIHKDEEFTVKIKFPAIQDANIYTKQEKQ